MMPGGYKLETNVWLQSAFEADDRTADKFAAAATRSGNGASEWRILARGSR
jgi:hypothetical protein